MPAAPRAPSAEAQAAKLRAILESAVPAILTIDDHGLIESINPATERLFGYAATELVGLNVKVLMPEPDKSEHEATSPSILQPASRRSLALVGR